MRRVIITSLILAVLIGAYFGRGFLPSDQVKQSLLIQYLSCYSQMQLHLDYSIEAYEQEDMEEFTRQIMLAAGETKNADYMINGPGTGQYFENASETSSLHREALRVVNEAAAKAVQEDLSSSDMEALRGFEEKLAVWFDTIGTPLEISKEYHPSSRLIDIIHQGIRESFGYNEAS